MIKQKFRIFQLANKKNVFKKEIFLVNSLIHHHFRRRIRYCPLYTKHEKISFYFFPFQSFKFTLVLFLNSLNCSWQKFFILDSFLFFGGEGEGTSHQSNALKKTRTKLFFCILNLPLGVLSLKSFWLNPILPFIDRNLIWD